MPTLKKLLERVEAGIDSKVANFERTLHSLYPEIDRVGMYLEESNDSLFLSDLYIKNEFRGQGVGTKIMNSITEFADNNELPIVLIPEPDDEDVSPSQLVGFYNRFGFVLNTGKNKDYTFSDPSATTMYRLPKK